MAWSHNLDPKTANMCKSYMKSSPTYWWFSNNVNFMIQQHKSRYAGNWHNLSQLNNLWLRRPDKYWLAFGCAASTAKKALFWTQDRASSQSYLASLQNFTMAKLKQCANQNPTFNFTDVVSVSLGCSTRTRRWTGARISSNATVMVSVGLLLVSLSSLFLASAAGTEMLKVSSPVR